ncbi:MAG: hypothetical protein ACE5DW_01700 [Thermodesulfobacteriota bacterium]
MLINILFNLSPAIWTSDQGSYFLYSHGDKVPIFIAVLLFIILILAAIVLVLWIAMPFSVFAVKRLLKECVAEQKKTNSLLQKLVDGKEDRAVREMDLPEIRPIIEEPRDF